MATQTLRLSLFSLLIVLNAYPHNLEGQVHPDTDSLFLEIKKETRDTSALDLYVKIIRANLYYDLDLAKACTDTTLQIAQQINDPYHIANSYHYYGLYYRFQGNADSALYYFNKALDTYNPKEDDTRMTGTLFNIGVMNSQIGNYDEALDYFIAYRNIHEREGNQRNVCEADNSIGVVFIEMKEFEKAETYLVQAVECAKNIDNKLSQALALGNLQSTYSNWNKFELSIKYGRQALQLEKELGGSGGIGFVSNILSTAFREMNQLDSASYYAEIAIDALESGGEAIHLSEAYIIKAELSLAERKYFEAIEYFNKSKVLNEEGNFSQMKLKTFGGLSKAYENTSNYQKSLDNMKKYVSLSDSIYTSDQVEIVSEIETKYQSAKKDAELSKQQVIINNQKHQRNLLSSAGLFSLLLAGFFWHRKNTTQKLFTQQKEIDTQKINQLEKEQKILSMNALIEGQEAERIRIAKDLHDGLGGLLATVKTRMSNITEEIKKLESFNVYEKTTQMVDDACDEVRRISHNLLPGALRIDGLKTAVEQLGEELNEAHPFKVKVEIIGFDNALDETKEVFLYRIIQEATNNIIKHADAENVLIQLSQTDTEYHLIIEDDGNGFDINKMKEGAGLGLKSMRSRVEHLQGSLDIKSKLGNGTTITIHIAKTGLPEIDFKNKI